MEIIFKALRDDFFDSNTIYSMSVTWSELYRVSQIPNNLSRIVRVVHENINFYFSCYSLIFIPLYKTTAYKKSLSTHKSQQNDNKLYG